MLHRLKVLLVTLGFLVSALGPLILIDGKNFNYTDLVVIVNFICWTLVFFWSWRFTKLGISVGGAWTQFTLIDPFLIFNTIFRDIKRKEVALSIPFEVSGQALFNNINSILNTSQKILPINSAELTLIDRQTRLYHGSFLSGSPFRTDINTGLRDGRVISPPLDVKGIKQYLEGNRVVLTIPIDIAGNEVGVLRIRFHDNYYPLAVDWSVIGIIVLQCVRALVEDNFTRRILRMREESEGAIKSKTGFLAQLSHELRAPLGVLLNSVQLVLEGVCGDVTLDQKETLEIAQRNGSHLLELVNDVLDYARAEAGRMPSVKEDLPVNELLRDVVGIIKQLASAKEQHIVLDLLDSENIVVNCDRRQARQILINLLTNGVKYTPSGGTIRVFAEFSSEIVRLHVVDTGIGIPANYQDRIFQPFERFERKGVVDQVGTGIGLSLTQQLVILNDGKIGFDSVEGQGSHFWVELKGSINIKVEEKDESLEESNSVDGEGVAVLVIHADKQERSLIQRYLGHRQFEVLEAASLNEAYSKIINTTVNLVVLDLQICQRDELHSIIQSFRQPIISDKFHLKNDEENQTIKINESDPNSGVNISNDLALTIKSKARSLTGTGRRDWVPVIALSGEAFHVDIEDIIRAGADRCLTKPVSLTELSQACKDLSLSKEP